MKGAEAHSEAQTNGSAIQRPNTQVQETVIIPQQEQIRDNEDENLLTQHKAEQRGEPINQGVVDMPRVAENKEHETKMIWEIANNLGVTEIEEQGRIVEKLMQMEDRDKKEAEKVGNRSHNS